MAQKTNGFVKFGVIIFIIAVILGGCKKDKEPQDQPTPAPEEISSALPEPETVSTPAPVDKIETVDNTKAIEKIKAATAGMNMEIKKIAASADGWNSVLAGYNGKNAPDMNMKDINDNSLSISGLKGKKAVIVKWSTLHEQSKEMIKTLAELQKQVGDDELTVIAISTDDPAILKPVVKNMEISFPVVGRRGVRRMTDPYRQNLDTPVCFFIDKTGKIQLIAQKVIPPDALNSIVEAL